MDFDTLSMRLGRVFQPAAPIDKKDLFYGRSGEIRRVVDAINTIGMHAVIYGEPGVGKTSLGKILQEQLRAIEPITIKAPSVTCVSTDDYDEIWMRLFEELDEIEERSPQEYDPEELPFKPQVKITPNLVRRRLGESEDGILFVIFDEFNKIEDEESRRLFADTIKLLSDRGARVTIILIGVAEDVTGLIDDHSSIIRCLSQIPMSRMPRTELEEIVRNGLAKVGMSIDAEALQEISYLSKGLPHYTHLLARESGRITADRGALNIVPIDVEDGIRNSIRQIQESLRFDYEAATLSARKNNFKESLLACAMTETDSYGKFTAADVLKPLTRVKRKPAKHDMVHSHLRAFCSADRGDILEESGNKFQKKYRFTNPLMQPFVILLGIRDKLIQSDDLKLHVDVKGQRLFWPT